MKVKILEYNILNGICTEQIPYKFEKSRLEKIAKTIEEENPDILVLCEGYFWPFAKQDSLKDIKRVFSQMYKFYASTENSFRWAPVVLSKFPVDEFKILSKPYLNLMRVKLKIKKQTLTLDVFHPHPDTTEKQKKEFLQERLNDIGKNYILTGDLNALSPEDAYDKKRLVKGYEKFMFSKGKNKVEDMLKSEMVKFVLSHSLTDSYKINNQEFNYTVPTEFRKNSEDSRVRMDYIFCSKSIKVLDSGIVQNKITKKASDHYPIFAELEI